MELYICFAVSELVLEREGVVERERERERGGGREGERDWSKWNHIIFLYLV